MKHTPGKWTFELSKKGNKYLISGIGWMNFCKVFSHCGNDVKEEAKANAKLIAAAPELLEACILMQKNGFQTPSNKDFDFLEEAIKKATK